MKKSLIALSTLCTMTLSANLENNAFISLHESEDDVLSACIIYEGHYYYAPQVEHYMKCPCIFIKCE